MCYLYNIHVCTQAAVWFTCVQHQPCIQAFSNLWNGQRCVVFTLRPLFPLDANLRGLQSTDYTEWPRRKRQYSGRSQYRSLKAKKKKMYVYVCPIPNGFRDRALSLYAVGTSNTPCPHMNCKVHCCWRWNCRKCVILGKLYQLCHLNNKYRY
jgi:hypothetical protein